MGSARSYDIVLFGATGFTGGLTAEYLARNVPQGCRWALAGRDAAKLAAVRDRLAAGVPACAELPLLVADAADPEALRVVAAGARVVISTVGPYLTHGEPLVAACAEAGTDYVDLTGEPEFVDLMYVRHHRRAVDSGARIVHSCGFDSVPHDLGVLFTVGQLPGDGPVSVNGYVRAGGTLSGGTLASALLAFSRPAAMYRAARDRRAVEPRPPGRRVRAVTAAPGWSPRARAWTLPLPSIDGQVVARSAAALPAYGPDFRYAHQAAVKWLPVAAAGAAGMTLLALAAQLPPLRRAFGVLRAPGQGPDADRRARSWFAVRFVGEGGGRRVVTEVSGGDPGYGETAKMLAESALCLAFDDGLPEVAGQLTTAAALGPALITRLVAAGIRFEVLGEAPRHAPGPQPR
ncbi:saccharopine dehydrogenase NADP-binding domain-containing protein [Streptomyces sp. SL13]|uniref:Saccharopine dehydrogenase NADP-binding domain-containing protein n=1 Tax=Streptantibioticus silvisoli TaxID=2705255 RepID=A0AA90H4V0_9ACTN|nr:saccharopine dehydrogenase NADP-binding domain-containing protein [Streptantibioticus silvisoli]MDI5966608.1 saccharopine dehydrogenase NADP-binding domain-containing protein [Streptantibioticus silvisoli]MDI5970840.1 saccharopine dehydrogenase NADP-binding domain-containing protein [Streptantibioticus silvisoli]